MRIVTIFTTLIAATIVAPSLWAAGSCQMVVAKEPPVLEKPVVLKHYEECGCYYNTESLLRDLSVRPDFDIKQAQVLFLGDFNAFNVHAVLLYKNHIIDADRTGPLGKEVEIVKLEDYMKSEEWTADSEVRAIDAMDYLEEFPVLGALAYMKGMASTGYGNEAADPIIDAGYPVWNLKEWLIEQKLELEPTR